MKYYLQLTITLLLFCAVGSGILAYVNSKTAPVIAARKIQEAVAAREALMPNADFEGHTAAADTTFEYFVAFKKGSKDIMGYTFVAIQNGYAAPVKTMVGIDKDMKITSIKVVEQNETPGLGTNSTQTFFTDQFKGKTEAELQVDKDGGKIKALSGATITSRAVTNSVKNKLAALRTDLEATANTELVSQTQGGVK